MPVYTRIILHFNKRAWLYNEQRIEEYFFDLNLLWKMRNNFEKADKSEINGTGKGSWPIYSELYLCPTVLISSTYAVIQSDQIKPTMMHDNGSEQLCPSSEVQ